MSKQTTQAPPMNFRLPPMTAQAVEKLAAEWNEQIGGKGDKITESEVCRRLVTMAFCYLHPDLFLPLSELARARGWERGNGWEDVCGSLVAEIQELRAAGGDMPTKAELIEWLGQQAEAAPKSLPIASREPQPA